MGEPRSNKTLSPHSIAAVASTLVLVVGLGLGIYFVQLRGPGLQTLMQGSQAQEILILFGALAAIAVTGHIAIANSVRQSRGSQAYRRLIHRALELDHTDPGALRQFEVVPELRDLVSSLIAEKSQTRELSDQIETLRGEVNGLTQGMERSIRMLGPLRTENLSDLGQKISALWNDLVERASTAEEARTQASAPSATHASTAAGESTELTLEHDDKTFTVAGAATSGGLEARLEKLENELERLWTTLERLPAQAQAQIAAAPMVPSPLVSGTQSFEPAAPAGETTPPLHEATPATDSVIIERPAGFAAAGPSKLPTDETSDTPFSEKDTSFQAHAPVAATSGVFSEDPHLVEPEALSPETAIPSSGIFTEDPHLVNADGPLVAPSTLPSTSFSADPALVAGLSADATTPAPAGESEAEAEVQDEPIADATERFSEWGGVGDDSAAPTSGFFDATDLARDTAQDAAPQVGFGTPAAPTPARSSGFTESTFAPDAHPSVAETSGAAEPSVPSRPQPSFDDLSLPQFTARPAEEGGGEGLFEAGATDSVPELPASALLFEPEDDSAESESVVDLRSLGAVEFKE